MQRRGHASDIVERLLDEGATDASFFDDHDRLETLATGLTTSHRSVTAVRDDEHNTWALHVDDRSFGYSRLDTLGAELVTSPEFRMLQASYSEIGALARGLRQGGVVVRLAARPAGDSEPADEVADDTPPETPDTVEAFAEFAAQAPAAAPVKASKDGPVTLTTLDTFVDHFLALGRKGLAVNRYKGRDEPGHVAAHHDGFRRFARCCRCAPRTTPKPTRCSRR